MLFLKRPENISGIILVVVLWVLVVLSILAIGLSRQTGIEVQLARYSLAKMKSRHAAISGVRYVAARIVSDSRGDDGMDLDTKYQCGFRLKEGQTPREIFKDVPVGESRFSVTFDVLPSRGEQDLRYGLTDEESRINLNALSPNNYNIIGHLLIQLGCDKTTADQIAAAIIDWRDEDGTVFNQSNGAENDYYMSLPVPYHCKNRPFESPEELLLVKGVTPEIFDGLRPYVTVFPLRGNLSINFDTAPEQVLKALARLYAGARTNTDVSDADSLTEKLLVYKWGPDGIEATEDDRPVDFQKMPLNAKERVVGLTMQQSRAKVSNYLRARIRAVEPRSGAETDIETVIAREPPSILGWRSR